MISARVTDSRQLSDWLDTHDILLNLDQDEITAVIQTYKTSGYDLSLTEDGVVWQPIMGPPVGPTNGDQEPWQMDELIDMACELSYEHMLGLRDAIFKVPSNKQLSLLFQQLKHEVARNNILNGAFDRTIYGKEVSRYIFVEQQEKERCR